MNLAPEHPEPSIYAPPGELSWAQRQASADEALERMRRAADVIEQAAWRRGYATGRRAGRDEILRELGPAGRREILDRIRAECAAAAVGRAWGEEAS